MCVTVAKVGQSRLKSQRLQRLPHIYHSAKYQRSNSSHWRTGNGKPKPFTDGVVNHFLVQTVSFLLDTLTQLFHIRDPVVLEHMLLWDPHTA